jgi:Zn-dependent peptidase ImmA (M78 family)
MGYSPWDELAGMPDITICVAELGDETLGWWDGTTRTLALNKRQSQRQMRCTLAHELEHAKRGDECGIAMSSVLAVRQEIAASARAARHLISMNDLISALLPSVAELSPCPT